ncbi:MAG: phosphoribosylamine--glycine ligase [Armatimonadota bacterium]|nr:phosphoribosylamine--glycine ligase [bacterium]MCS7308755.1 phosphoribosylamine--glycine ligase [Armatimonadota bacterium]MDW8103509.1 phosphoribosylamine--glycine ligase [Armatimonadota bacterium]MDW8289301.1 phosphoribosylamine--glycine ligase [Armatimonadota bacterium]
MRVLVIGGGGREHALVWKIAQSPKVSKVYAAPGNAGIAELAECVPLKTTDLESLANFAERNRVDLTVVGPESPLIAGVVDVFERRGLAIFGPSREPARLEGSKVYAKEVMRRYHIPTAEFSAFSDPEAAAEYAHRRFSEGARGLVVKADGEAAGKGVFIVHHADEALEVIRSLMEERVLGEAGERIVIEEVLTGEEASLMVFSDGVTALPMPPVQDYKRALDHDRGSNTGGMGSICPLRVVTPELQQQAMERIIYPAIRATRDAGIPFRGVLYAGTMVTDGEVKTLEFNVRFGDPETQVVLPLLENDLVEVMQAAVECRLEEVALRWKPRYAVCVVVASGGYPGKYEVGLPIEGLEEAAKVPECIVFHAGTRREGDKVVTAGGRVLGVTALGDTLAQARGRAYDAVRCIRFEYMHYRTDIGIKWV